MYEDYLIILVIASCVILFYIIHRYRIATLSCRPIEITIEQHVYRIPIEDQTDLVIDDEHNVHNKCLKRTAVHIIQEFKQSDRRKYTIDTAFKDIKEMIELSPDLDIDKLDDADRALNAINRINTEYQSGHIKEIELIRLIWERINHPINIEVREQLKCNLIEQLADCQNGAREVHCCEGRVMRLIQTFEGCDTQESVTLRPLWAYKEEIANQISKYRDKLLNKAPKNYRDLEQKTELNDDDKRVFNAFNHCLIKNLTKRFEIDYVSKGLLSTEELNDLTKIYYDSLYDF